MTRKRFLSLTVAMTVCLSGALRVSAQPPDLFLEYLADFEWTGGGANDFWQNGANWDSPTDPGLPGIVAQTAFPNDPGRMDEDDVDIVAVVGANFSVPLAGDLTVDINGSDVTVASVQLGGTGTAVTTDIDSSTGNRLIFENFELNDTTTNPADPNAMPPLLAEPIWSFNQGVALIWSTGTQGAGKENRISADIELHDALHVEGDRDLHIFGNVIEHEGTAEAAFTGSLTSLLSGGATLFIHGDVVTNDVFQILMEGEEDGDDQVFFLNSATAPVLPEDPQNPPDNPRSRTALIDLVGRISGDGNIDLGHGGSTIILRGDSIGADPENPVFSSRVFPAGTMILDHDNALGGGDIKTDGGTVVISTSDSRNIPTDIQLSGNIVVRGASSIEGTVPGLPDYEDHSIEFSGTLIQTNTRSWVNQLEFDYDANEGPTLTISGPQYPVQGGDNNDADRVLAITGPGKTLVTGGIHNEPPGADFPGRLGHLRKQGSGTVVIAFDENNTDDMATNYGGDTYVEGGNLHFATNNDLPDPADNALNQPGTILSRGGAVGVDEGLIGNNDFLNLIHNSTTTNFPTDQMPPFFKTFTFSGGQILTRWDHGGLMLGEEEYDDDLDFSGDLANGLGRAANMTLAAWETGSTYTGTITPSSTVTRYANTYQLGGGRGTLTLPEQNQLTGERHLRVDNGGEVRLESTNDYTGTTEIRDNTTLTVTSLADGNSSIGTSTDAADLVLQDGTLRYVGGEVSTNRLFTLGTAGGTIDSSGEGPINFTNSGPLAIDVAEDREGIASSAVSAPAIFGIPTFNGNDGSVLFDARDLVPGMAVSVAGSEESAADPFNLLGDPETEGIGDDLIITGVPELDVVIVGEEDIDEGDDPGMDDDEIPWTGFSTTYPHVRYNFGPAPARELTLTGDNTGDNTLSAQITDASDRDEPGGGGGAGDKGSVDVIKSGPGKWILANENNTYTGETVVEEGILAGLSIGTGGAADLIVEDGGTISPGLSVHTLVVGGIYNQRAGGTYHVEIAGSDPGQYDVLDVQGDPDDPQAEEGDYNEDGLVNAADYVVWRNLNGQNVTLPNEDPDAETPGVVDEEDYDFWVENFGDGDTDQLAAALIEGTILIDLLSFEPTVGDMFAILMADSVIAGNLTLSGDSTGFELIVNPTNLTLAFTGAGAGASALVPEPSSLVLAGLALIGLAGRVRRRD